MARRREKIAQSEDAVSTFCFMLGVIAGLYLFVLTLINFSPLDPQLITPPPAPAVCTLQASTSPTNQCSTVDLVCSPPTSSNSAVSDKLKFEIAMWNRFLVSFFLATAFAILPVRQRVGAAAKAEAWAASEEDKAYKPVVDKKNDVVDAAKTTEKELDRAFCVNPPRPPVPAAVHNKLEVLSRFESAFKAREDDIKEAEKKRSLVGLARMGTLERRMVRSLFVFAIVCSLGVGICAAGTFFKSLQLQMRDPVTFATIFMFAVPGVPFVFAHLHFLYAAMCQD